MDALEGELRQLREARAKQPGPTPPPPAPSRIHRVMFAGGLLALVASIGVVLAEPVTESVAEPAALAPVDVSALRTCRAAIAPSPHFDAAQTDPRRTTHAHVRAIEKTGAPCRAVLDQELAVVSGELRERLRAWVVAEDELVGAITRTVVYYEADPYAVDGYRSAPQLWREYDRAVEARDLALARVAPML
ncbi:MAG: hypothetical protein SFX73_07350 [Kofleriaceae bacterium]|nr:hypothetical protein [Kofleriaceae bacterium]